MTRKYTLSETALEQRKSAGKSTSRKKRKAAKQNGKLGGRPKETKH